MYSLGSGGSGVRSLEGLSIVLSELSFGITQYVFVCHHCAFRHQTSVCIRVYDVIGIRSWFSSGMLVPHADDGTYLHFCYNA